RPTRRPRTIRQYGNAAGRSTPYIAAGLVALAPLLPGARCGVIPGDDVVGDVDVLGRVDHLPALRLQDEGISLLTAVLLDDVVEPLDDARRQLPIGALEVALEVLVLALEVEGAGLEVLLEVAALLVLQPDRLLFEILARAFDGLLLALEGVLGLLELRLHLILGLLPGVALVQRPLHGDHG